MPDERAARFWRANLELVAALLSVWALVSYGFGVVLVEPLNRVSVGGFPLGFWFAQQGSICAFIVLIAVYVVAMDRLERRLGPDACPPPPTARPLRCPATARSSGVAHA